MTEARRFPTPRQRALLTPIIAASAWYFRARAHGVERIPADRPVLFVGKHPRGWLYLEIMVLGWFVFFRRGGRPSIRVMEKQGTSLHEAPLIGLIRRNVNAIPATEEAALAAFAGGESVLMFPGGPREMFGEPDVLQWAGRRGFARIAARGGVAVVPFAIAGADRQHPWRVRLGKRRTLWLPPVPLPVRMEVHFGAPMDPPPADDPGAVDRFADAVAAETQRLLDAATGRSPRAGA